MLNSVPTGSLRRRLRSSRHSTLLRGIITHKLEIILKIKLCFRIAVLWLEVDDEAILDREHGVIFDMFISPVEDLRRQWLVAFRG
jgi:hypothetical protein